MDSKNTISTRFFIKNFHPINFIPLGDDQIMKKPILFFFCSILICSLIGCKDTNTIPEKNSIQKGVENQLYIPSIPPSNNIEQNEQNQVVDQKAEEAKKAKEKQEANQKANEKKKQTANEKAKKNNTKSQNQKANPYKITIQTAKKKLTLYKNGTVINTYDIAVGKSNTPTPKGTYKIVEKAENPGGPFGSRWLGLSVPGGHYGIHGTNNPDSIGESISHGCIRMNNESVKALYKVVEIGTPVEIS